MTEVGLRGMRGNSEVSRAAGASCGWCSCCAGGRLQKLAADLRPRLAPPVPSVLQKKGWTCRKEEVNALRAFKRRVLTYPNCSELLLDEFLREGLVIGGEEAA